MARLVCGSLMLFSNYTTQVSSFVTYTFLVPQKEFREVLVEVNLQSLQGSPGGGLLLVSTDQHPYAYFDSENQLRVGATVSDLTAFALRKSLCSAQVNITDVPQGSTLYIGIFMPDRPADGFPMSITALAHSKFHVDGELCPANCSSQGTCESGKCVCFKPFRDQDCSVKVSMLELNQQYDLIVSMGTYRFFHTEYNPNNALKLQLTKLQGSVQLLISFGRCFVPSSDLIPTAYKTDSLQRLSNTTDSLVLFFETETIGVFGLTFAIYSPASVSRTQSLISILFTQKIDTSSASIYVIVGVLLGAGTMCLSCCLICARFLCKRKKSKKNARVHVYQSWSISGSNGGEQEKIMYDSSLVKLNPSDPQECIICLETLVNEQTITVLPCKHMFHTQCISAWFEKQNFCCVCKATYEISRTYDVE